MTVRQCSWIKDGDRCGLVSGHHNEGVAHDVDAGDYEVRGEKVVWVPPQPPPHPCADNAVLVSTYRPRGRSRRRGRWKCTVCRARWTACDCHGPYRHPWVGKASGDWAHS